MYVYIGNSNFETGPEGGSPNDALTVFAFNEQTGGLTHVQTIGGVRNPSYMARHPTLPVLYVVERWVNPDRATPTPEQMKGDCLAAFAMNPADGTLSLLGRAPTGGESPMHVQIHRNGKFAFTANPGRPKDPDPEHGHATAIRLGPDGAPGAVAGSVKYTGRAPTWRHRPKTYPHSAFTDIDGKRLLVPQLMTDRVTIYDFDETIGQLSENAQPYVQVSSGAGPRHLAFHPDGKHFYLVNSFDGTLSVFSYDVATGASSIVQTMSLQPAGYTGGKSASHVLVSPDGRTLYCSHRSHRSIVVFSIDAESGELTLIGHRATNGERPRDFAFDPSHRFMLVTNQLANSIVTFRIDPETGDLTLTGEETKVHAPNCVVFGPA